jgi:hypothetical protein
LVNKSQSLLLKKIDKLEKIAESKLGIIDKEFWAAFDCLHDEIRDLPSEVDWILPSDRLPLKHELDNQCRVLATLGSGNVEKVKFHFGYKEFNPVDNVIAWQPIPKPYSDLTEVFKRWFGTK